MGMPGAIIGLAKRDPVRHKKACRKGGLATAVKRRAQLLREDILEAAAKEKMLQEEATIRESTNENLISADGEIVQ
jgi:hypothetical protein